MNNNKSLRTIINFEFNTVIKSKGYLIGLGILVVGIIIASFIPRIISMFNADEPTTILINDTATNNFYFSTLSDAFPDDEVVSTDMTESELSTYVNDNKNTYGVYFNDYQDFTYIVQNYTGPGRIESTIIDTVSTSYTITTLQQLGLTLDEATTIANTEVSPKIISTNTNNTDNYAYIYITCFALYMTLLLFGQLLAGTIASEKSTKVVEVLVTSTSSDNLIFGKIIGVGLSALFSYVVIILTALISLAINREFASEIFELASIFNISPIMIFYSILFTILGYIVFSDVFAIIGAIVSKPEEISTVSMIPTLLILFLFVFCIQAPISGTANSMVMKVLSFIPFTSPMAMIVRICIGDVSFIEIIVSVLILIATIYFLTTSTAKVYKKNILNFNKISSLKDAITRLK